MPPNRQDILDSSNLFNKIFRDSINGKDNDKLISLFFYKGIVTGIDEVGKAFDEINPPRSVKVKVLEPIKLPDEKVLYPINDFIKMPISVGEVVLFIFTDSDMELGYYFGRIPVGSSNKVKAEEYYQTEPTRSDEAAQAFGDVSSAPDSKTTESNLLYESNDINNVEEIPSTDNPNEDCKIIGRADSLVLKEDGSFEIGEGATEQNVLGNELQTYLTSQDTNNLGKLLLIGKSFETLLPIIITIITLAELIATLISILQPPMSPLMVPIIDELNKRIKELTNQIPLIGVPSDAWLSKIVKTK